MRDLLIQFQKAIPVLNFVIVTFLTLARFPGTSESCPRPNQWTLLLRCGTRTAILIVIGIFGQRKRGLTFLFGFPLVLFVVWHDELSKVKVTLLGHGLCRST